MIMCKRKCENCKSKTKTNDWLTIGETVHTDGGKAGDTEYDFLQCSCCGTVWIVVQDLGGLGGNGIFYYSITDSFYGR
jgi:hypothetical protein